jgi:hypothetical protein
MIDPSNSVEITPANVQSANVLSVLVVPTGLALLYSDPIIISTLADRSLRIFSGLPPYDILRFFSAPAESAILCVSVVAMKYLVVSTMTGRIVLLNPDTGSEVASVQAHKKYVTRVIYCDPWIISSSYDKVIKLHRLSDEGGGDILSLLEAGEICLATAPEALAVVDLSDSRKAIVFSRRDSTFLYYHHLTSGLPLLSQRNLAPYTSSLVSYHAMSIAVHPSNPQLLAVVTSSVPVMKFLLVEVDTENIIKEVFTGAPQSAYSIPMVVWRPDGSGVWINGDEGVVRGLEVKSGKVRCSLEACSSGEKVRTMWAGELKNSGEILVTGAFDKGLKVWCI